ncbi:MAG TPA: phosphomannose isomerase type II C-terminal cupin domain [Paracoccaceae bacterium]|nr:phosphomannose isomerase type II C-terminal cupin domain [Paracoccaceae bacterium]
MTSGTGCPTKPRGPERRGESRRHWMEHERETRPWGGFEVLADRPDCKVKRIWVDPGGRLSLQSHRHRSERWVVVAGTARVTIGDAVTDMGPGEVAMIPQGAKHRLENPGTALVEIVEVQLGDYFGEDDIIRYEDVYGRT